MVRNTREQAIPQERVVPFGSSVAVVPILGEGDSREIVIADRMVVEYNGNEFLQSPPHLARGRVERRQVLVREGLRDGQLVQLAEPRVQTVYFDDGTPVPETITETVNRVAGSVGAEISRPRVLAQLNGVSILAGPGRMRPDSGIPHLRLPVDLDDITHRVVSGEVQDSRIVAAIFLLSDPKLGPDPAQLPLPRPRTLDRSGQPWYDAPPPPPRATRNVKVNFNRVH